MLLAIPLRWSNPASWPWLVYLWLAGILVVWARQIVRALKRKKSASWPTVTGRIESAEIPSQKTFLGLTLSPRDRKPCPAELRYSYSVGGQQYSGSFKEYCPTLTAAQEFVRDLNGRPITVHYDPQQASISTLLDASVQAVLEVRPPGPAANKPIPGWLTPLLWPLAGLSAIGLAVSLWVHFGALLGRKLIPSEYFWILHMGIFVVWFPTVVVANKVTMNVRRQDYWKVVLRGAPKWMLYMVYGFLGYAVVNFLYFMVTTQSAGQNRSGTSPEEWRGFSGHWMAFYSAAFAVLYSAARTESAAAVCVNGHPLPPGIVICPACGQPERPYR